MTSEHVKLVKEVNPGMADTQVLDWANKEKRIVVSNDKDFIALSVKYSDIDIILFDYLAQSSEIRISGLKKILNNLKTGFGIAILQ